MGKATRNSAIEPYTQVDELGGLDTALATAIADAGLTTDDESDIFVLPKPKTFFEFHLGDVEMGVNIPVTPNLSVPLAFVRSLSDLYRLRLFPNEPIATILPFDITI